MRYFSYTARGYIVDTPPGTHFSDVYEKEGVDGWFVDVEVEPGTSDDTNGGESKTHRVEIEIRYPSEEVGGYLLRFDGIMAKYAQVIADSKTQPYDREELHKKMDDLSESLKVMKEVYNDTHCCDSCKRKKIKNNV